MITPNNFFLLCPALSDSDRIFVTAVSVNSHFFNGFAPFQRVSLGIFQVIRSRRSVNEKYLKVFRFDSQFRTPGYFSFENHAHGIRVVQVRTQREHEHTSTSEQTLSLVYQTLFEYEITVAK